MVAGGRRDAILESRQSSVRPRPSDPHGPLFEESILLRVGTIIRKRPMKTTSRDDRLPPATRLLAVRSSEKRRGKACT